MPTELRQLRYFVAVAEHSSLGRAAEALGMTQPALTRSLQILEHQFGVSLFTRSKTGVVPTDEGRVLLQRAREVVRMADDLDRDARRSRLPLSGHVTLGAGAYVAETIVAQALGPFAEGQPLIRVRVVSRDWDELLRLLRAREVDFFVGETSTLQAEHDVEVEPLSTHAVYYVARSGHPLAHRAPVGSADTFAYPFVAVSRHPPRALQPMLAARPRQCDPPRPFPAVEIGHLAALKRVVETSDGIAALSLPCVADELREGSLILLGTEPWMHLGYGFVTLKGRPLGPAANALRDRIREAESALLLEESALAARYLVDGAPSRGVR